MQELRVLHPQLDRPALLGLLKSAGIRLEPTLTYCCGLYENDTLLACGGYEDDTIKCLAVAPSHRGEALLNTVVSHLYKQLRQAGKTEIFLFTKPENTALFKSLGFHALATTQQAALLTSNPAAIARYLEGIQSTVPATAGTTGAIVMNANPFTSGHRYLAEQAAAACDTLHIFVVEEERSAFPYAVRHALVKSGVEDIAHAYVHGGGRYSISAATFPTYFLKDPGGAAPVHAALDATLFAQRLAPPLFITRRFLGSEPADPLTKLYNDTLEAILPRHGIALTILPRLEKGGQAVSASRVRALLQAGKLAHTQSMLPETTFAYLNSQEGRALLARMWPS